MRILMAHNRHETSGGADHVLDQESRLLSEAGHSVHQFVADAAGRSGLSAPRLAVAAVWNRAAAQGLADDIRSFAPDVVHVHTPFPVLSPAVFRAAHELGVPTVTTSHSFRYSCIAGTCRRDGHICEDCVGTVTKLPGLRHRCYHDSFAASAALTVSLGLHRAIGTFARHVDRFVTLTEFARALLVRDGVAPDRVVVKPNFVPDPGLRATSPAAPGHALFVGRLVEEKGIQTLLTAWREVGERLPLWVAGDGPLRELVEAEAAENPAVRFLGWRSAEELQQLQRSATITVVPSEWYEAGPPLVLLQALASGTPVVCSDLENICSSVVAASAGRSFVTGRPDSLAAVVLDLLGSPVGLAAMSERARALYEDAHTPGVSLAALERIYASVLEDRDARQTRGRG